MEKVSHLLNENTIINFRLLFKLGVRYRLHFIIAVALFFCIFSLNYYKQPVIYEIGVPLKIISPHSGGGADLALTTLIPIDNNATTLSELKTLTENYSFLKTYAELVISDQEFDSMNFAVITSGKSILGRELNEMCVRSKDCLIERLVNYLKNSFQINSGTTENRFKLTVNTLNKRTVQRLAPILIKAIEANRIQARQYVVLKESQNVGKLIDESRSVMEKMESHKVLEEQERLQNDIIDLKEKIRMLQHSTSTESGNAASLESRLAESKKFTNAEDPNNTYVMEKMKKAHVRLAEVKQNIFMLSNISANLRSVADTAILNQLKEEQAKLLKIVPMDQERKVMETNEKFIEGQRGKSSDYALDYLVTKNKLSKLTQEYEDAKGELSKLLQQKIANENKVAGMKTDIEFLKSLEAKQMTLKLFSATMTSDLLFEDGSMAVSEYRQVTFSKFLLFSFSVTFFLYVISILMRYFADDKIYGEDEVRRHLKNLDFVGTVPVFK